MPLKSNRLRWRSRPFAHLREIRTIGEVEYDDGRAHIWLFYPKNGHSGGDTDIEGFRYAVPDGYDDLDDESSASYYAPAGVYLELEKRGGGWRLIGRRNDIAIFNSQGSRIELRDRHRQAQDADEQGSTLSLEYDLFGQLIGDSGWKEFLPLVRMKGNEQ